MIAREARWSALLGALAVGVGASGSTRAQVAAEWPEYRGPQGSGVVAGELPLRWSESSGVRWKGLKAAASDTRRQ